MMRDGGRGATGGERGKRLSALLVMAETALTVVLLAGSGVMIRSLVKVYTANLGFDPARELMMTLLLPQGDTEPEMISLTNRLKARLESVPGIDAVAIANSRPYLPFHNVPYEIRDAPSVASGKGDPRPKTSRTITTPDYFRSLGQPMLAGRDFNNADGRGGNPVAIVNRQFASAVWPNQDAMGKHLRLFEGNAAGPWLTVIGIAPDIAQGDFSHRLYQFLPEVYLPYPQKPSNVLSVQALTRVPPATLTAAFYRELRALDRSVPLAITPQSMAEDLGQSRRYQDSISLLFLIFAAVALLLASIGLYSVVAHSVSRRTQEIGVRIALGATGARILSLISRQAIVPVGVGLAAGLAASLVVNRVLDTFIVGVSASDPIALAGAIVVLIFCAALGCLIPARRAARIDPAQAIRYE
jgi:predicted permease